MRYKNNKDFFLSLNFNDLITKFIIVVNAVVVVVVRVDDVVEFAIVVVLYDVEVHTIAL